MSQIVQDMTKLNTDLNEKVSSLNSEIEKVNQDAFQAKKKAEHVENLERDLQEQVDEHTNLLK